MGRRNKRENGEAEGGHDEDIEGDVEETTDDEGGVDTPPPPPPPPETESQPDAEGNFEVDQIVDMEVQRRWKCPVKFRVRWVGFGEKDDTWLPVSELSCDELINEFLEISGRTSEFKTAMAPKKRLVDENEERMETRKVAKFSYSELDEDDDEVIPAGTRTRRPKTSFVDGKKPPSRPAPKKKKSAKGKPPPQGKYKKEPEDFEVESVVDHRVRGRFTEYKVRWKGFGPRDDSWIPEAQLNCDTLLNKYFKNAGRNSEETYEVEAIMGLRLANNREEYKVRWKGWSSKYDSWLAEDEMNCPEILNRFKATLEKLEKQEDWQVEKILATRDKKGKKEYQVKWLGFDDKCNTWEPEENLEGCPDVVKRYNEQTNKKKEKLLKEGRKTREDKPQTQRFSENFAEGTRARSRRPGKNRSYSEYYDQ